jgi:glycosyltransferase involved in cell wall biosynthesis
VEINVVVGGLFHYKHYVKKWGEDNFLNKIYYSHKFHSLKELPSSKKSNIFLKEYLMYAHIKSFGAKSAFSNMGIYNEIWDVSSSILFKPADVNLILLQGNSSRSIEKSRKSNSITVGEAVNIHPRKMIKILHEDSRHHGVDFFWSRHVLNRKLEEINHVDYLLTPSVTVANSYISEGFPESKVLVIPYGIDSGKNTALVHSRTHYTEESIRTIKVLCVAQVFPRKGQYHLLKAISSYQGMFKFNVTLIGISDPSYLSALKSTGIEFDYHKALSHSDVLIKMANSDVVILNSLEDGFGMVVTEAMSVGVPVAVSQYAGAAETVRRLGGGLVYDPLDYNQTIKAIIDCFVGDYPRRQSALPTWTDYAKTLKTEILKLL